MQRKSIFHLLNKHRELLHGGRAMWSLVEGFGYMILDSYASLSQRSKV